MASVEKMFKFMLEELQHGTTTLNTITQNQEIMIVQNKQIIELLEQVRLLSSEQKS